MSNGAQIFSGDVLRITGNALNGYNFSGLVVNGAAFTSGNSITVSGKVTVSASATLKSYQLISNQATGSWINVTRNGVALSSGATIYHFDTLIITAGANSGYELTGLTVNGSTFTSGGSVTVSGNVSISTSATVKQFVLSISAGTGTTITVNRTSSPKANASTGVLSNGATIYYGDVLKISGSANTGYNFGGLTVNNTTFTSGNTTTVTSAVSVASTATLKSFTLSINAKVGSSINVNRTSSINTEATIGNLNNGSAIYYGDILKISMSVDEGYYLGILTVNGSKFTNGSNYTVYGNVSIVSSATKIPIMEQAMSYIYDGTNYNLYVPYIYKNGEWVRYVANIHNK